jgi:hypothetical protein
LTIREKGGKDEFSGIFDALGDIDFFSGFFREK